jgi:sporulation protein YlmC with PRC-barrel domain
MKFAALAGALALFAVSGAVSAQTAAPTTTNPAPATAPATTKPMTATTAPMAGAMSDMGGLKMANSATLAVKFVTVKPADVMSSKLVGVDIYNNQNEKLGEVDDLVIENGKTLTGLVVGVGGFLGMGESYVVLDPSTVVINQQNGSWRAFVDTNKDTLKNAPKFQYTKKKS